MFPASHLNFLFGILSWFNLSLLSLETKTFTISLCAGKWFVIIQDLNMLNLLRWYFLKFDIESLQVLFSKL